MAKTAVVLGARNLGGAIIDRFLERGWNVAGVARSNDTLEQVRERGALALSADAADDPSLRDALSTARAEFGSLDAVVNAVSAARPTTAGPFGGGALAAADLDAFRGWTVAVAEQAFVFLSVGAAALREGNGGALIQITAVPLAGRCRAEGCGPPARSPPAPWCRRRRRSCDRKESTPRC
jgi:NAD(P)-dependent dehydrogenase (short-subunit alcohol dehydrogenase family)